MWTQFWDMHSGGRSKEQWTQIFIEAPIKEAQVIFYNRFGHNPNRVTCTCCGDDYITSEYETLEEATAFHRGCKWSDEEDKYIEETKDGYAIHSYMPLNEFIVEDHVLVILKNEIKSEERIGDVPDQIGRAHV